MWRKKQWQILPQIDAQILLKLSKFHPIIARLLANRGLVEFTTAAHFLNHDKEFLAHDPFLFRAMRQACDLIIKHIKTGSKIAIAGDYDADGVTSSAVLAETLQMFKAQVQVWIPSRMIDGYGLNRRLVGEIAASGAKLLITVDNGVRSFDEIAYAKSLGLDTIVTDHHTAGTEVDNLPDGLVLNPVLENENYPWKYLAGVGVAYKLASALISLSKLSAESKELLRRHVLDLVAIGTVADCVSLLDENRHLVREGLKEINRHPRPGLTALINASQIRGEVNEWHIGWQIAPRLNVAGRLAHANTAYELLVTKDALEAAKLADKLNEQNVIRQLETERIVEYCHNLIDKEMMQDKIIVLSSPDITDPTETGWFEGVIGLVAGKIAEYYHKPSLVICQSEGKLKGSGRSIGDYSIIGVLEEAGSYLERFGGHRAACGFSVKDVANLKLFTEAVRRIGQRDLTDEMLLPKLRIEAVLELGQITKTLVDALAQFAPFGQGNPVPIFASYNITISDIVHMGVEGQHVKFRLGNFWAVSFGGTVRWSEFQIGDKINIAYTLEINEFNGYRNIQMKVVDMVRAED